jgi:hypothetical protein
MDQPRPEHPPRLGGALFGRERDELCPDLFQQARHAAEVRWLHFAEILERRRRRL